MRAPVVPVGKGQHLVFTVLYMLAVRLEVHRYPIVALIWISFIMSDGELLLMGLFIIYITTL